MLNKTHRRDSSMHQCNLFMKKITLPRWNILITITDCQKKYSFVATSVVYL